MRGLERAAGVLSLAAAIAHVWAGPAHAEEWWAAGVFFFALAAFQAGYGLAFLTRGIEGWGGWEAVRPRLALLGIVVSLLAIAVWTVSRTSGLPFGPEAFEPEPVGSLDVVAQGVELALVFILAAMRMRR